MSRRWYVFGFVEKRPGTLPDGPLGAPVTIPLDEVDGFAIASPIEPGEESWEDASPERLGAAAMHHDDVLSAALQYNVVPARFGGTVGSFDEAAELGHLQGRLISEAFDASRGCAEFDVRLETRRAPVGGSGRDYLMRRRDQLAGDDELGTALELIVERVRSSKARERSAHTARVALLATRAEIDQVRRVLSDRSDIDAEIRGPYPPYAFTRTPEDAARVEL